MSKCTFHHPLINKKRSKSAANAPEQPRVSFRVRRSHTASSIPRFMKTNTSFRTVKEFIKRMEEVERFDSLEHAYTRQFSTKNTVAGLTSEQASQKENTTQRKY